MKYVEDLEGWPERHFDVAWSINMLYQVPDHQEMYGRVSDLLLPGGRFILDDWMVTDLITEADLRTFRHHFQFRELIKLSRVESDLAATGFFPALRMVDRGDVGRGPMRRYFQSVMEGHFLPRLLSQWPDAHESGISGRQMVLDFTDAVNHTIDLYEAGKLTYRTLVAVKR